MKYHFRTLSESVEKPGSFVNKLDLQIIRTRFWFAEQFINDADLVEFGAGSILGKNNALQRAKSYCCVEVVPENAHELEIFLNGRGRVIQEDCCATSLTTNSCDVVIALAMVYYVDMDGLLREAHRILRSGGCFVFCCPNKDQPFFRAAPGSTEYYRPEEIFKKSEQAGFECKVYGAYDFKKQKSNFMAKINKFFGKSIRLLSPLLNTFFPQIYKFLKQSTRGGVIRIPDIIEDVSIFEKPRVLNIVEEITSRIFYFELRKIR